VPAVVFAVKTADVATPFEFVVAVFTPPAKVPLAPFDGAVNVTTTPLTATPLAVTVAVRGDANAACITALCDEPLVTAIESPTFVRLNPAGAAAPAVVAITV
jgi:hypothetical protein